MAGRRILDLIFDQIFASIKNILDKLIPFG
jgi:hypothetical protein